MNVGGSLFRIANWICFFNVHVSTFHTFKFHAVIVWKIRPFDLKVFIPSPLVLLLLDNSVDFIYYIL